MYQVYLGERSQNIIFGSLLTTFERNNIYTGSKGNGKHWLKPKIKPSNQVKITSIYIPDTHSRKFCQYHDCIFKNLNIFSSKNNILTCPICTFFKVKFFFPYLSKTSLIFLVILFSSFPFKFN